MKKGFTTGSCAAAAAKAAAYMLLSGKEKSKIEITTPAGVSYCPQIEEIDMAADHVSCAVRKDAGDDPDITNGTLVFAKVYVGLVPNGGILPPLELSLSFIALLGMFWL